MLNEIHVCNLYNFASIKLLIVNRLEIYSMVNNTCSASAITFPHMSNLTSSSSMCKQRWTLPARLVLETQKKLNCFNALQTIFVFL